MGGQCLSGRLRDLHCARWPGGGLVWRAAGIDGRISAIRRSIVHNCHCRCTSHATGRTDLARPCRSIRGALTHIAGWRVIFWLNALIMLVALAGMAAAGSATMRADGTRGRRVDWVGFISLATFMVALIFGLHEVPHAGVVPLPLVGALLLAAAAFVLLVSVEARAEAPLVDLSFFA